MSTPTRRLAIALAVSVALNLFAAGFFVARSLHPRGPLPPPNPALAEWGPFLGPRGLLGEDARSTPAVREVMKRHRPQLEGRRGELRAHRRAVREALLAEPFEPAALEKALASLRASTAQSQERMHAALVDLARQLPPEQRRQLARQGERRGPRPPH